MKVSTLHPRFLRPVAAALLALPSLLVADTPPSRPTYTLYMGADISLEIDREFRRVEDVQGSDFVVRVDGNREFVSTHKGTARMRIDNELKLGGTAIVIEKLETERDYTPGRDPRLKFQRMAASWSGASAGADLSTFRRNQSEANLGGVMRNPFSTPEQIADAQAARDAAVNAEYQAYYDMGSDMNSVAYHQQQMELELAEENYDAMRISFQVSSPTPLERPYVLVIARIQERDERADLYRNWIFAQRLDPIGPKPGTVRIKQGGLPVGFKLVDCQVRLFNAGVELPTNQSPNSVALTREEALQYLAIEHAAAHKEATLPPVPAFGEVPADLKARVASGEFVQPFYVKVAADGSVRGTYLDRECTHAATDPYVGTLVGSLLFKPALEKGQPVEGVARLQLGTLIN